MERQQNIQIQEQEILRKEKELDSKIKQPAEAEKYRLERIAQAEKQKIVLEAEAEAEARALKGEAEAFAIEVVAKAEAEQMAKKADAWKEYKEAALVDMMLKVGTTRCHGVTRVTVSRYHGVTCVECRVHCVTKSWCHVWW